MFYSLTACLFYVQEDDNDYTESDIGAPSDVGLCDKY